MKKPVKKTGINLLKKQNQDYVIQENNGRYSRSAWKAFFLITPRWLKFWTLTILLIIIGAAIALPILFA